LISSLPRSRSGQRVNRLTNERKTRWALTNPHLSLHIPTESRIAVSTSRKKNGAPRRPRQSLTSILSNLHLLLTVPSFARWPLRLHFFADDVYRAWTGWCGDAPEPLRPTISVVTDFASTSAGATTGARAVEVREGSRKPAPASGIHALPLDYAPVRPYVEKARSIFEFEREGSCVVCGGQLPPGEGLYAVCPRDGCEGVGHLDCWSRHLLEGDGDGPSPLLPIAGHCPSCQGQVEWKDMMTQLSLRVRGKKEVDKLLKKRKAATSNKA